MNRSISGTGQVVLLALTVLVIGCAAGDARDDDASVPWWQQQKMRFMWGQWNHERVDLDIDYWGMNRALGRDVDIELPRQLFRDLSMAGVTVFVEQEGYRARHARYCRELGMKYFATRYVITLHSVPGRTWVSADGEQEGRKCSLDQSAYTKWIFESRNEESIFEGVRDGLIDGIQFDWEGYGGRPEPGLCYCHDCMAKFPGFADSGQPLPPADQRDEWIQQRGLTDAFLAHRHKRRLHMWTNIREKLHAVKPDLLFASYDMLLTDFSQAMHTHAAPFIVSDAQHYFNDHRQPWWDSYAHVLKKRGYLYVPGGWMNGLFGAQASEVSAARWIYEAAINHDGVWLWFERELGDDILRAYSTADRQIQGVVSKVGRYLGQGAVDHTFATAVEWSGRPGLQRAIKHKTYRVGDESLVHVSNVHTEWPMRVTMRFPRIEDGPAGQAWSVSDAVHGLTYVHDMKKVRSSANDLRAGVTVALEPRSDVFLLLSPVNASARVEPSTVIRSRAFEMLTDWSRPPSEAGAVIDLTKTNTDADTAAAGDASPAQLVYTATEPMGMRGSTAALSIANSIRTTNTTGEHHMRLRQLRAHLWQPKWSPDGWRIMFVQDVGGRGQIHVMNADGSGVTNLSDNEFCDRAPAWSPDGQLIAFVSDRTGEWDIYVMNADGSDQRRVAGQPGYDFAPVWSPNGAKLAWESHTTGTPNVWVCDADGGNERSILGPDVETKYVILENGKQTQVEPIMRSHEVFLTRPVWSPDGRCVAGAGLWKYRMVYCLAVDGSQLTLLRHDGIAGADNVCWSPDGKRLAGTFATAPQETERAGIVLLDAVNGKVEFIVSAEPTGPRAGAAQRWIKNTWYTHGSAQPRRTMKTFTNLAWARDNRTLAFTSDMAPAGAFYIYTFDTTTDGAEAVRLDHTFSVWPNEFAWRTAEPSR